jgi:membrane fusion protein (multidrug efflux system)
MKVSYLLTVVLSIIVLCLPACDLQKETEAHEESHKILATSPEAKDVVITQKYVCQIHSRRNIYVRALESGYLEPIHIKEGQMVKQGDILFKVIPYIYQAKLDAERAEVQHAQLEFNYTKQLADNKTQAVSQNELLLYKAKLAKAEAKLMQAEAEFNFATVKASFDGVVGQQMQQQGSLIKEGDNLTTLSDNSTMWVYFNVPEARYLDYMATKNKSNDSDEIRLLLANGTTFPEIGKIGAIEAQFNNETGNIAFRADFPNPTGVLRHGQTGNVAISRTLRNVMVIPQRATFEILDKRYVYVIDENKTVHQREIVVDHEQEDIFVVNNEIVTKDNTITKGITPKDKIILEGIRQVKVGEKVEAEFQKPQEALSEKNLKYHAE